MTRAHLTVQVCEMGHTGPSGYPGSRPGVLVRRSCLRQLLDPSRDFLLWQLTYEMETLITLIRVMTMLDSGCIFKDPCNHQRTVFTPKYQHYNGSNWGPYQNSPSSSHDDQMSESRNTLNVVPGP